MKRIEVILKEEAVNVVKAALDEAGFSGMTLCAVKGRGQDGGIQLEWRAGTYHVDFIHRTLLMLLVEDSAANKAIGLICQSAHGGHGLIIVSPVEQVIRLQ